MYIEREIEPTIGSMFKQGKVVLVTGSRQVGKAAAIGGHLGKSPATSRWKTLGTTCPQSKMTYCSSNRGNLPLIIDEVQRAPELFSPIRWVVEQSDEKGRIVLFGSRAHHLMKGASESLAGRIRIVELPPLSLRVLGGRLRAAERYGRTMGGYRSVLAFRSRVDAHRGGGRVLLAWRHHAARALRSGNRRLLVARPERVGRVREELYSSCTNPPLI